MTQENQQNRKNPWNGLRTYMEGEVLYGRSDEINVLSLMILQSHQTVVYGRSGIGKSSILNAGIFPIMRRQGVFPVYIRFEHNVEKSYLNQIKDTILREIEKQGGKISIHKLVEKSGDESLWEFFHRIEYRDEDGRRLKPMIVFDQFEEIFTLENDKEKIDHFFRELADLINNVMPQELTEPDTTGNATEQNEALPEGMLDLGLDAFSHISYSYNTESDYHLVFTLREDFLSYLERNTTDIPALKNNRYCLQPINEEQAAEIIMKPRPGLVDPEVAKLIIKKVTGETDIEIDGNPKIQVDSAILSLYLSRLYDKMIAEGETRISSDLVETHSANIIEDFYNDAIRNLSDFSVEMLETNLINDNGRRDNRDRHTIMNKCGLTGEQYRYLVHDVKLLREFVYGGDVRVEYIHDVLCDVIVKHRQEREEALRLEEVKRKAKKDKRNLIIKATMIASSVVLLVMFLSGLYVKNTENVKILEQQQNVVVTLAEDSTTNFYYWEAMLKVTGYYENDRDTLLYFNDSITNKNINDTYPINIDSCQRVVFELDYGDFVGIGDFKKDTIELTSAKLMESPYVRMTITRKIPNKHKYDGKLVLDVEDLDFPLKNAYVMVGDAMSQTDSIGIFRLSLTEEPTEGTVLMVAQPRLGIFEYPIKLGKEKEHRIYRIMPTDSMSGFRSRVAEMDSIKAWHYATVYDLCRNKGSNKGLTVTYTDGKKDRLKLFMIQDANKDDRNLLSGYFYFVSEMDKYMKTKEPDYAKFTGSGYIDKKPKTDEKNNKPYYNFEFVGYDVAENTRTIKGRYYPADKGKGPGGFYDGYVSSGKHPVATFKLDE